MKIIESNLKFKNYLIDRDKTTAIVVHHTYSDNYSIEDVHRGHLKKGWSGCGYHYLIRKDGTIYTGRKDNKVGAHAYKHNHYTVGIALEGSLHLHKPTQAQMTALEELCHYLIKKYGKLKIMGHREVVNTSCPGKFFPMEDFKAKFEDTPKLKILDLQKFLNSQGFNDYQGKKLTEDGIVGRRTRHAFDSLKGVEI